MDSLAGMIGRRDVHIHHRNDILSIRFEVAAYTDLEHA